MDTRQAIRVSALTRYARPSTTERWLPAGQLCVEEQRIAERCEYCGETMPASPEQGLKENPEKPKAQCWRLRRTAHCAYHSFMGRIRLFWD